MISYFNELMKQEEMYIENYRKADDWYMEILRQRAFPTPSPCGSLTNRWGLRICSVRDGTVGSFQGSGQDSASASSIACAIIARNRSRPAASRSSAIPPGELPSPSGAGRAQDPGQRLSPRQPAVPAAQRTIDRRPGLAGGRRLGDRARPQRRPAAGGGAVGPGPGPDLLDGQAGQPLAVPRPAPLG